ncbi:MAG: preprotein translocase subunit SecA [Deltaproteobacteria bacterium]
MLSYIMKKIVGTQNDREIKKLRPIAAEIGAYEKELTKLPTAQLRARTDYFRDEIKKNLARAADASEERYREKLNQALWEILPEAFAVAREASRRTLGMRHFDVQLIGGMVLHQGKIAEMKTGEGKTLVAALTIYLNGLTGLGVHLVTVNDYLARRDATWMGPIYKLLGLRVGVVNHEASYLLEWEDPQRAERAVAESLSVWPDGFTNGDVPPEKNLDAFSAFKTKLIPCTRKAAYAADATYGTNNEFGFDYLRDNMKFSLADYVQREHNFAIVDEVDSILIDEARTPLIISGPSEDSTKLYYEIDTVVRKLKRDADFTVDEKTRQITPTEDGSTRIEKMLGVGNVYDPANLELLHHVIQALRAHNLFQLDVDYMISDGKVVIVDEFTGRLMPGRRWSDGLHQAIEAKEGVQIENENQTLATITIQNYFRMYHKLAGMTGTADTEAFEFKNIYKLDVSVVPTHRAMIRADHNDSIYRSDREKLGALVKEIRELNTAGRPVLVGTTSIEKSEKLSRELDKAKIPHQVLNAKHHEKEAEIVAQAGRIGAITIATNMAGRGTDILLGGNSEFLARDILRRRLKAEPQDATPSQFEEAMLEAKSICEREKRKVIELGGLTIIGTERHESRRIDNQLRGRSGRQGDPGASRFFVSLEDDLMRIFASERISKIMDRLGWEEGEPIEAKLITKSIENAQKQVEARNFDIRKHLLEYDDVLNTQRDVVYRKRREFLQGENLKDAFYDMAGGILDETVASFIPERSGASGADSSGLTEALHGNFNLQFESNGLFQNGASRDELIEAIRAQVFASYEQKEADIGADTMRQIERFIMLQTLDYLWKDHLLSMDHLREGIGLRGYAQKDPLYEYKKEGYAMFSGLIGRLSADVCEKLFRVKPVSDVDVESLERKRKADQQRLVLNKAESDEGKKPAKREQKVGRNDPCPCGSGKKYKKCCGAEA